MTSHSTHIASDCEFKNLNVLFKNTSMVVKSFSPFFNTLLSPRESLLLKRYLDATRSEIFFASAIIFVEGVAEQFIIPAIAKAKYGLLLTEYNISIIPIHSRYFDPFLKLCQDNNLEIPTCAIMDGDSSELKSDDDSTTAVENAKKLEVDNRVKIFVGNHTLEIDLFPSKEINSEYLKKCFGNLGHKISHTNLLESDPANWANQLISRIDQTVKKGRFAQELSTLLDKNFCVPNYIDEALKFIMQQKGIAINC